MGVWAVKNLLEAAGSEPEQLNGAEQRTSERVTPERLADVLGEKVQGPLRRMTT